MPRVVLRLPDLSEETVAEPETQPNRQWTNVIFWVAIVAGALVAAVLIFGARKPAEAPAESAPAWDAPAKAALPAAPGNAASAPSISLPMTDGSASWPHDPSSQPAYRTARSESPNWDGSSAPRAAPGQATPLGISTPEQP